MRCLLKRFNPDGSYTNYKVHAHAHSAQVDRQPICGTPGTLKDWRFTSGPVTCRRCKRIIRYDTNTPELPL
jgi:hypothetical protein